MSLACVRSLQATGVRPPEKIACTDRRNKNIVGNRSRRRQIVTSTVDATSGCDESGTSTRSNATRETIIPLSLWLSDNTIPTSAELIDHSKHISSNTSKTSSRRDSPAYGGKREPSPSIKKPPAKAPSHDGGTRNEALGRGQTNPTLGRPSECKQGAHECSTEAVSIIVQTPNAAKRKANSLEFFRDQLQRRLDVISLERFRGTQGACSTEEMAIARPTTASAPAKHQETNSSLSIRDENPASCSPGKSCEKGPPPRSQWDWEKVTVAWKNMEKRESTTHARTADG